LHCKTAPPDGIFGVQIDAGSVVNENLSSVVCLSFFFNRGFG